MEYQTLEDMYNRIIEMEAHIFDLLNRVFNLETEMAQLEKDDLV